MGALSLLLGQPNGKFKVSTVTFDLPTTPRRSVYSYTKVDGLHPTQSSPHPRTSCTIKQCIVLSAVLLSLLLNIVLTFYLWKHVDIHDTDSGSLSTDALVSAVDKGTICMDCFSVGVHPGNHRRTDLHGITVHHVTDSTSVCCLENAEGLQRLLAIFADRFFDTTRTRNQDTNNNDSTVIQSIYTGAHVYLESDALTAAKPSLEWTEEYGYGSAYRSNDIYSDNNTLRVTKSGLYCIYSFFTFKTHQRRRRPENIIHTIRRTNTHLPNLGSTVILLAKKTMPEVSERFVTSFLSATVRLRQDDHVFVHVSNMSYIYRFPPSNFFGLYFVGT
ncbi:uncharacterized protein LOC124282364 isoform X1 [Haliotis rubra]|uniref:uncharacterized protein LOC124282364 isoform X1 n=1 Tax=Haliotis rubra TaxID=36100 RepID=UPI001EE5EC64|nr:uncharacterized protein LOC124282364 isoform X1 [Haliotis rubra]